MFYINADPHGNYNKIKRFCTKRETTKDDIMILLGDVAFNFAGDVYDEDKRKWLSSINCTFFCIHGNHEMRPEHLPQYKLIDYHGGKVWIDEKYPNVLFAKDGEIFDFNGYKCIVLGGAYSVDKYYRLMRGWTWHSDEQPSEEIKQFAEKQLEENNWKVDYVFSHTAPVQYEPVECFLPGIDQSTVDKTTEIWLGEIEKKLDYKRWYIGHYHVDKTIDKMRFIFNDFLEVCSNDKQ